MRRVDRSFLSLVVVALTGRLATGCSDDAMSTKNATPDDHEPATTDSVDAGSGPPGASPDAAAEAYRGPFIAAAYVEDGTTVHLTGEGDLWPSCWSDDDALYAAHGDGAGFGDVLVDIGVDRITGSPFDSPPTLAGVTIAKADAVGQVWTPGGQYNRKPTGIFCADGDIYVAVQDLNVDFGDSPAATIAVSHDHGSTWSWDHEKPMFTDHTMTTLMFLDFGKNNENAIDGYAYVYALDQNWRFSTRVPSPTKLWLARAPKHQIQDRTAWTYFAGFATDGAPQFVADAANRKPVIEDSEILYSQPFGPTFARDMTTLSQGGVVYDAPLNRYLYTSWTEYTFEFFEAPKPWGPWKKFLSRDFGAYPWSNDANGGYGTSISSKFMSADGKTMFVQSNTFNGGYRDYELSLRKLFIEPHVSGPPENASSSENLATRATGAMPVFRAGHAGPTASLNDGALTGSVDSWTGEKKTEDFWGVTWPRRRTVTTVAYTTGKMFGETGGWFTTIRVQVLRDGEWKDVPGVAASPGYPGTSAAGDNTTYVFSFAAQEADGVRVVGEPGGTETFTSAAEIAAFYR